MLSDFQPNFIKIDIKLVRNIDSDPVKQAMVKGIILTVNLLNIKIIAEGVETVEEAHWFKEHGISLMQGYYFARQGFKSLPKVTNWDLT